MIDGIIRRMSDGQIWISLKKGYRIMPEFFLNYLRTLSDEQKVDLITWLKREDFVADDMTNVLSEGDE